VKSIDASKFKERCLSILDHLDPEGIVITKYGKPVATLIPAARNGARLIGSLRGRIRIRGDLKSTGAWRPM
jgi:antitoxin (DNA-binding transcriptional repressor) of toxin-antitoxin stability system